MMHFYLRFLHTKQASKPSRQFRSYFNSTAAQLSFQTSIGATVADGGKNDPRVIKGSVIATGWSLFNAAYAGGCLLGPLFAGLIRNAAGWQTTTWCLGLLSAITGVFFLLCLGDWIGKLPPKTFVPHWLYHRYWR